MKGYSSFAYLVIEARPALLHHPLKPGGPVSESAVRGDSVPLHDLAEELHQEVAALRAHVLA